MHTAQSITASSAVGTSPQPSLRDRMIRDLLLRGLREPTQEARRDGCDHPYHAHAVEPGVFFGPFNSCVL